MCTQQSSLRAWVRCVTVWIAARNRCRSAMTPLRMLNSPLEHGENALQMNGFKIFKFYIGEVPTLNQSVLPERNCRSMGSRMCTQQSAVRDGFRIFSSCFALLNIWTSAFSPMGMIYSPLGRGVKAFDKTRFKIFKLNMGEDPTMNQFILLYR